MTVKNKKTNTDDFLYKKRDLCLHVLFNKSNILATVTDLNGRPLKWFSCGKLGLKGFKKGTLLSAQKLAHFLAKKINNSNVEHLTLITKGFGKNKINFIKSLLEFNIRIYKCIDMTSIPFNGCRPKKKRKI